MQAQRSPQTNPSNYSLSGQVFGQQTAPSGSVIGDEQKGYPWAHTIPMRQAIASTRPPQFWPSSSGQMRSNTGYPPSQTNLHKANEMGNMSDGKGVHMLQTRPPNNSIPVQTMQHHMQWPQTSSPVFGANSIHARPFPRPVGGPTAPFRPQMADSNPRAHLIQGAATTVSGSVPTRSIVSWNAPVNQALGSSKVSAGMESQSQQLSAPKPLAATSLSQTQSHGIQEEPKIQGKKQLLFESLPATDLKVRASGMWCGYVHRCSKIHVFDAGLPVASCS